MCTRFIPPLPPLPHHRTKITARRSTSRSHTCAAGHRRVGRHEVELGRAVVAHEEVALVLVGGRIGGRLRSRRQAVEVELVRVPLAVHLGHDVLVVVVPAGSADGRSIRVVAGLVVMQAGHEECETDDIING